jgi:two-component system response regulator LytT
MVLYRVAICDDEKIFLAKMQNLVQEILNELGIEYQIDTFSTAKALMQTLEADPSRYQILLLDILMDQNGVQFAKELREKGHHEVGIVFVTSAKEYSLEGYSVFPIHYLTKPVQKKQLAEVLIKDYRQNFRAKKIVLPVSGGCQILLADDIYYIELLNRTVIFHLAKGHVSIPGTLKRLEPRLPEGVFLRCHKSFAVNINKIQGLSPDGFRLLSGVTVPIGRVYRQESLQQMIAHFHGG